MTEFLEFENKNTAVERIAAFDDMPNSALLDVQELVALGIGRRISAVAASTPQLISSCAFRLALACF